jgi:hypothetical protein
MPAAKRSLKGCSNGMVPHADPCFSTIGMRGQRWCGKERRGGAYLRGRERCHEPQRHGCATGRPWLRLRLAASTCVCEARWHWPA